jgi:uncharacterized protein
VHPYLQSLLGGGLIGAAAAGLLLFNGRIAGVSGILSNALALQAGSWRWGFLAGLLSVGLGACVGKTPVAVALTDASAWTLAVAGLLAGVGSRLSNGCTSGHGVCGLSSLSLRSLAATATFMLFAGLAVFTIRHGQVWLGGMGR